MENHFIYTYQLRVLFKKHEDLFENKHCSVQSLLCSPRRCKMQHVAADATFIFCTNRWAGVAKSEPLSPDSNRLYVVNWRVREAHC
jgi:hypothetical protein